MTPEEALDPRASIRLPARVVYPEGRQDRTNPKRGCRPPHCNAGARVRFGSVGGLITATQSGLRRRGTRRKGSCAMGSKSVDMHVPTRWQPSLRPGALGNSLRRQAADFAHSKIAARERSFFGPSRSKILAVSGEIASSSSRGAPPMGDLPPPNIKKVGSSAAKPRWVAAVRGGRITMGGRSAPLPTHRGGVPLLAACVRDATALAGFACQRAFQQLSHAASTAPAPRSRTLIPLVFGRAGPSPWITTAAAGFPRSAPLHSPACRSTWISIFDLAFQFVREIADCRQPHVGQSAASIEGPRLPIRRQTLGTFLRSAG